MPGPGVVTGVGRPCERSSYLVRIEEFLNEGELRIGLSKHPDVGQESVIVITQVLLLGVVAPG